MRVIFLTHNYPRHHGDVAGAFLHPLAVTLRDRGVDVRVVAPADRGNVDGTTLDGVPITRVRYASADWEVLAYTGNMGSALKSIGGMMALAGMMRALKRGAIEAAENDPRTIVHAHWWVPAGMAAPTDLPMVLTCHGTDARMLTGNGLVRFLGRRTIRRARVVTTVSTSLAETIAKATGITQEEVGVQPMPIPVIDRPRSDRRGPVVILGRMTPQKRVDLAVRGYRLARDTGFDRPLVIVGDGPTRGYVEEVVRGLEIESVVTFVGEVTPELVPHHLAGAAMMLMTARDEGFGLAAAEALIQGVPLVVCEDGGGLVEVVGSRSGSKVVPPKPEAIASAIRSLGRSEKAGNLAAEAGRRWAAKLSPAHAADACLTWYDRALRTR